VQGDSLFDLTDVFLPNELLPLTFEERSLEILPTGSLINRPCGNYDLPKDGISINNNDLAGGWFNPYLIA